MKHLITLIVSILLLSISVFPNTDQLVQRFTVSSSKGNIELWSKESKKWVSVKDFSQLTIGSTIAVRDTSELQITFEPAIFLTIRSNSIITLANLVKQPDKKIIRMSLKAQTGSANLQMQSLNKNTVLFSIETPSAVISMSNTDAEFSVTQDITMLQVLRGEARINHNSSDVKSLIFEGSKATIYAKRPVVEITSASENSTIPESPQGPTIAILSIQSSQKHNNNNVEQISDIVAEHYQNTSNAKVLYLDDIKRLLKSENVEGLINCFSDSCIAKISTLIGVDMVILGDIGQIGQSYVFSLRMIDALNNKTLKRITTSVDSNLGLILTKIPSMVGELVNVQKTVTNQPNYSDKNRSDNPKSIENIVWIKGGTFTMGMNDKQEYDALPTHKVTIKGFYMDIYEVTKEEFKRVMGTNPSSIRGCEKCPVDNVSWFDAMEYCKKVGKRLPTEAEWEYACRAGTTTDFHYGNTLSSEQANFDGREPYGGVPTGPFRAHPIPVGKYQPNDWGLYDMHGNVAEWCSDWYDPTYYGNSVEKQPAGPENGKLRVARGGSWNNQGTTLRCGKRTAYNPIMKLNTLGFRCVKDEY